jgi:bacillopeptidase F (M6 metalloprotease family)
MAGSWSIGTPGSGPAAAASPPRCIAVALTGDYGSNLAYASNYVRLPAIDLSSANNPVLTFNSWMEAESGWDGGRIEVSLDGGTTWNVVPISEVSPAYQETYDLNWTGTQTTWAPYTVQLSSYIGNVVHLRFAFISDGSIFAEGWYVDDIIVTEQ